MYNDPSLSTDLQDLLAAVLRQTVRENHPEDLSLINAALASTEEKPSKETVQSSNELAAKAVASLQGNLDAFLGMFDEEEEEEKHTFPLKRRGSTRQYIRDITPQFQCCVCHSDMCGEEEDSPCLLVHTDYDYHSRNGSSNSHYLVFTYFQSFIPVCEVTTDGSLHDQARSFKEQLSHYSWYDPILILVKNLYDRAPEYRENGMKPSVTSCGHMLHYRCMQSLLESSNLNLRRSKSVFCPVCRRLERGIIPALAHILVDAQWREQHIQQISWTEQCQNKSEFQECLKDLVQEDKVKSWWISEEMNSWIDEVERENSQFLRLTIEMFGSRHSEVVKMKYLYDR